MSAPAADVLVFEHSEAGFSLIDGVGRGAGWAGIVDVESDVDSLIDRAWQIGTLTRRDGPEPGQIAGPYYARHAVAVPVGDCHVVVFGSDTVIDLRDSELVRQAAAAVDRTHGVPTDKLLADELELVHVLRALMAYRPETVRDTMRHIATVAASALSCELATIRVEHAGGSTTEAIALDGSRPPAPSEEAERHLAATRPAAGVQVTQAASPGSWLFGTDVASHLTLPLGSDPLSGALVLGHSLARPRGFTSLCQRIGRAVADAADLLISQASAREQLAAERDLLARMSATDALTGIGNRRAWDEVAGPVAEGGASVDGYVVSCDLDGLKAANDRWGHASGDALIRATAFLLSSCLRETDVVARVGGDEFAILLRDSDRAGAVSFRARVRRAERMKGIDDSGLMPRISLGFAPVVGGDVEAARHCADALMYANKRRRRRNARYLVGPTRDRRRPRDT